MAKKIAKLVLFVLAVWIFMGASYFLSSAGYDILVYQRLDLRSDALHKFWVVSVSQTVLFCLLKGGIFLYRHRKTVSSNISVES